MENYLTLSTLKNLLHSREISSVELTKMYLNRIENKDSLIGSYITVCSDEALKSAEIADKRIAEGNAGNLTGIPFAIKDNICTKSIKTTCASKMLADFVPPYDATVVEKLKNDGAVLLGKLNMDEFAMGSSTETSYFKKTKNPHNVSCVPGGSSGGSAACVATDLAAFALGSDTGGSVRQPAAFCGTVGLKPTYGTVSRYGLIAYASSFDQIGVISKNVSDAAMVLNCISGYDKNDSTSANRAFSDFIAELNNSRDLSSLKIGVPKEYLNAVQPEIRRVIEEAIQVYEELGAHCEFCSLPMTEYALPAYYVIASAEASSNLSRYDGVKYGFGVSVADNLTDLYTKTRSLGFGDEVKRRILLGTFVLTEGFYDAYYKKAQQVRSLILQEFSNAFNQYDVLLTPTTPTTAFTFGTMLNSPSMYMGDICTVAANVAGLPAISVPAGTDNNNKPIGIQLMGNRFCESAILKAAYAYEKYLQ